jgi:hypothetical protein
MSAGSFRIKVLLRSEQTDGQVSVIENTICRRARHTAAHV